MRDQYRRGEFESRNRQLPADLDQKGSYATNARARSDFESTPTGAPPVCYDVRSVFDSRPVNTFDFHITQSGGFTSESVKLIEMTVPEGYVAVLRTVEVWFESINPTGANRTDVMIDAFLNGGAVPYNENLRIGVSSGEVPFFYIANEFDRIGVRIQLTQSGYIGTGFVHFYGNFILKSGRPPVFEVANPVQSEQCAPTRTPTRAPPPVSRPSTPSTPIAPPSQPSAPVASPSSAVRSTTPPFPIQWRAFGMGNNAMLIPIQNDLGQRRDLSTSEISQYASFLNAQKLSKKEREMFGVFLRSIGMN